MKYGDICYRALQFNELRNYYFMQKWYKRYYIHCEVESMQTLTLKTLGNQKRNKSRWKRQSPDGASGGDAQYVRTG